MDWNMVGIIGTILFSVTAFIISIISIRISIKSDRRNVKISLYEKRYVIYKRLDEVVRACILNSTDHDSELMTKFFEIKDEIVFLFDKDIRDYVLQIINNFEQLDMLRGTDDESFRRLHKWFIEQIEHRKLRDSFNRYLDINS